MKLGIQKATGLDPRDIFFWTFRRNESDVINLYDSLGSIMQVSTGEIGRAHV